MCIFLRNPPTPQASVEESAPVTSTGAKDLQAQEPPRTYDNKAVALTLHNTRDGWRLVVPNEVIGRLRDVGLKL